VSGLSGRRVLVVGASAGIGRAFAMNAVREGGKVALVARRADRLAEVLDEAGGGTALVADVTQPDDVARAVGEAIELLGQLDLVVYAAGVATLRRLGELRPDEWQRTLDTNLLGLNHLVAGLVGEGFAPGAVVMALSSETVGEPRHGMVPYAVSKAALEEALRGWQLEHPEIRFCAVRVGATQPTEFGSEFDGELLVPILDEWIRHGQLPGTFMDTDELARLLGELAGTLLAFPGIGIEHVLVRSPAPPMTGLDQLSPQ
jgi:NAD(P)-dependent dehydrogenase (short-subunit alcohol dehydrogenase family)